jgi:hypothetical protein
VSIIVVPRPSKNAMNPDRPVSSLLLAQIQHLQHAERRLPLRYRTEIYTHAIRTEGEAAGYIREVTEAIHRAHVDAVAKRAKGISVRKSRSKVGTKRSKDGKRKNRRFS